MEIVTSERCKIDAMFTVSSASGYIASVVTSDTPSCDGSRQPWLIGGERGQRVNLTLYDFAVGGVKSRKVDETSKCRQYGVIEDSLPVRSIPLCGSRSARISHAYLSTGSYVKVWITAGIAPNDLQRFVIRYSG